MKRNNKRNKPKPKNKVKKYGKWSLKKQIGSGGNGAVWRVSAPGVEDHALKLLNRINKVSLMRFESEATVLSNNDDIEGIITIVDKGGFGKNSRSPWFVMPIGTEFRNYRKDKAPLTIAKDFVPLAETLVELHSRQIAHRDIKPANILFVADRLNFSDFGLVKYPDREDITRFKEDVGPKFTMAPEMRRNAHEADGLAADVYSFAKLLWIALSDQFTAFDGQYKPNSYIGLNRYCSGLYLGSIDRLIEEATDNDPGKRPNVEQFCVHLKKWIELNEDFHNRNLTEWFDLQNALFPTSIPNRVTWTDPKSICSVLNVIGATDSLNHMFYPGGGGMTIVGASEAPEYGLIELNVGDGSVYDLLKPLKLTFESFGVDPEWDYFRLEAQNIEPTGVYDNIGEQDISEELTEIRPGEYHSYDCWNYGEYNGDPLPLESRPVTRYLNGSFVIFCTRSRYNRDSGTYDGRHNDMDENGFREYIESHAEDTRDDFCSLFD